MNRAKKLMILMAGKKSPFIKGRFVLLVKSDNAGTSEDTEFTLTGGEGTNYPIDWFEKDNPSYNGSLTGNGAQTIDFGKVGEFYVQVGQPFNRIQFNNGGDRLKLLEINQWGDIIWGLFVLAFSGCTNLLPSSPKDTPILGNISIAGIFLNCTKFNMDVSGWDVSSVTNIGDAFSGCSNFDSSVKDWNVQNVTNMFAVFLGTKVNENLSNWVLNNNITELRRIFRNSAMSCENYTDTIVSWINQAKTNGNPINVNAGVQDGMTFANSRDGGDNYDTAGDARTDATTATGEGGLGWTISGDTVQESC